MRTLHGASISEAMLSLSWDFCSSVNHFLPFVVKSVDRVIALDSETELHSRSSLEGNIHFFLNEFMDGTVSLINEALKPFSKVSVLFFGVFGF